MITTLSPWQVQIQGAQPDLEHLAACFTSGPFLIRPDDRGQGFLYESTSFIACTQSEEVLKLATEDFTLLSGVLKLLRDAIEPLRAGAVYRTNAAGGRDAFVHIQETLHLRVEASVVGVTVHDSQGNVVSVPPPPPRTIAVARLAVSDSAVAKVMRLLAESDAKSWVGLYRIHEVVEADIGGEHALKKRAWGSSKDLKRFKHSANSVAVAGDRARHGKELEKPPAHPMTPDEAHAYVNYVLQAWLAAKGA